MIQVVDVGVYWLAREPGGGSATPALIENFKRTQTDKYSGHHGEKPSVIHAVSAHWACNCDDDMCKFCHPENFVNATSTCLASRVATQNPFVRTVALPPRSETMSRLFPW